MQVETVDLQQVKSNDFRNPTPDDPVEVSGFLSHTDLTQIMPELMEYYAELEIQISTRMFKATICFGLSTCRFLSEFWRRVEGNPGMAINLVEIDEYGSLKIT